MRIRYYLWIQTSPREACSRLWTSAEDAAAIPRYSVLLRWKVFSISYLNANLSKLVWSRSDVDGKLCSTTPHHYVVCMSGDNYWRKFSLIRDGASLDILKKYCRAATLQFNNRNNKWWSFGSFTSAPWRTNNKLRSVTNHTGSTFSFDDFDQERFYRPRRRWLWSCRLGVCQHDESYVR